MAFTKKPVTLTNAGGGSFTLAVGNEAYTFGSEEFLSIYDGRRSLDMLFVQLIFNLNAAGVNPRTDTFAHVKAAVEGTQVNWGN